MYQAFSVSTTFGVTAPASMAVGGFADASNPFIPVRKDYLFRKDLLRALLAFLSAPKGDGLYITGPTGSGKTSLVEQVAARIHWPVHTVTGHGRLELNDLPGQYLLLGQGGMQWVDGPLTRAVRHGHIFLVNERRDGAVRMEVGYPEPADEIKLLADVVPTMPQADGKEGQGRQRNPQGLRRRSERRRRTVAHPVHTRAGPFYSKISAAL